MLTKEEYTKLNETENVISYEGYRQCYILLSVLSRKSKIKKLRKRINGKINNNIL